MSSKLNVGHIIKGHLDSLKNSNQRYDFVDLFYMLYLPGACSLLFVIFDVRINTEIVSLLVNFGSIVMALLLSVLVLVFDQEGKISSSDASGELKEKKISLLKQLYDNISFSIIMAVLLVIFCFFWSLTEKVSCSFDLSLFVLKIHCAHSVFMPFIIFLFALMVTNILMIVKRVHTVLNC